MGQLQQINLGQAPTGAGGDDSRTGFSRSNANFAILATQAALTSAAQIGSAQALTANHVGKRVNINLASAGTIKMPPLSVLTDQDSVILLRNLGSKVATLAAADGTNDWMGLSKLNPGEVVLMDGFANGWNVLMRSRTRLDNEIVNGTLTVGGGIVGDLPVSGKVNAVNGANLLLNGSAEFGLVGGWSGFVGAYNSGTAEGTFLSNTAALSAASYAGSNPIAMAGGVTLTVSGEIYAGGVSSGNAWFRIVFINSSGGVITVSPNVVATPGAGWTFGSYTVTTPTGTATVYVQIGVEAGANGVTVSSGGVAWRRLKLEKGSAPSLYSQEASVAYLQGVQNSKMAKAPQAFNFVNSGETAVGVGTNIVALGTFTTSSDASAGLCMIANGSCYIAPQAAATSSGNAFAQLRLIRSSDASVIATGNLGGLVTMSVGSNSVIALSASLSVAGLAANTQYTLQLMMTVQSNIGVSTNAGQKNASMLLF